MLSPQAFLALYVLLAATARANPTTIGCVGQDLITALLGALLGGTFNNIASASVCAARCDGINRQFAYWSSGNSRCYCANTGPNINQLTTSAVTVAGSTSAPFCIPAHYHVQTIGLPSSYNLQSCATPASITGVTAPPTSPQTINACLTACSALYSYALVTLGAASTCTCARGVTVAASGIGQCQAGNTAVYRNLGVIDPAPSGLKKRRKFEPDKKLCPGNLAACLIEGQGEVVV